MASKSLFEDCQSLIEKGHEKWKSYFSKWESFAKYEEDIPESELFSEPNKKTISSKREKLKQQSSQTKLRALSSLKYKKNQLNHKKLARKKRNQTKSKQKVEIMEECIDHSRENLVEDMDSMQLETILKSVFTDILQANKNEFQIFTILSQTISGEVRNYSQPFHNRQALPCNDTSKPLCQFNTDFRSGYPSRSNYSGSFNRRWSLFESKVTPGMNVREQIRFSDVDGTFPRFHSIHNFNEHQLPLIGSPTLRQTQIILGLRNSCPALPNSLEQADPKLKSLEYDLDLKSPNSVCRKINKEYFIKRSFLKMNIAQDGKRFRNLCLRKRTNSVTLSMENSNFITPERKPPERKCFSENVLQRKRTCPSKLFFGNEEEDSESDNETEKQTPIIHCRKKLKTQTISEIAESDSDDCESIFDRVKAS